MTTKKAASLARGLLETAARVVEDTRIEAPVPDTEWARGWNAACHSAAAGVRRLSDISLGGFGKRKSNGS